jgi:CO/xanthine dehydrogenase Mo-binding subunit
MDINAQDGHGKPYGAHVYATQMACVTVDDETGEFTIDRIYAAHDCGTAINPMQVEGQIYGGVGMGVGFGVSEKLEYDNGRIINDQFTDYIIPTAMDVPPITCGIIQRYDPSGAYGAKGIGEPSLLPTASAICNAIFNAVGVLITDLPITYEKVYMALKTKKAQKK